MDAGPVKFLIEACSIWFGVPIGKYILDSIENWFNTYEIHIVPKSELRKNKTQYHKFDDPLNRHSIDGYLFLDDGEAIPLEDARDISEKLKLYENKY